MHAMADTGRSRAGVSGFAVILAYVAPPPALRAPGTTPFVTEVVTAPLFDLLTRTIMGHPITQSTRRSGYGSARVAAEWDRETPPPMILLTAIVGAFLAGVRKCPSADDIGAVATEPVGHG